MADDALNTLCLLHGVNLDMLGRRDPAQYGTTTLAELEALVTAAASRYGFAVRCLQTNHEGALIEEVHRIAVDGAAAVIINPGAWTHYSYALHDALEMVTAPVAEVHLSAVDAREPWRRQSVIADVVALRVSGRGADGYIEAVRALARLLGRKETA
jgi:3-dehydroquinate dehydratase-2